MLFPDSTGTEMLGLSTELIPYYRKLTLHEINANSKNSRYFKFR